jgi:hypothetical protein
MVEASIADWITAGATAVAAVGTVGALWIGALAFLRQADTQRKTQASRVSVARIGPREVVIRNQSDMAIHYVSAWFKDGHDPKTARYAPVSADTLEDVVPAGGEMTTKGSQVPAELHHSAVPYIQFTDAEGRRWQRGRGGELALIRRALPHEE